MKPHVLTKLVKASIKELMVLPQVSDLIADRLGYKFGVTEEKAFMTGNGTNKPLGIFVASDNGIKTSSDVSTSNTTTAVTFDGLQAAKFTLPPPYWPNAKWVMSPVVTLQIATIKDTLGSVNLPIICAGQLVNPGDVVVADDDGVVIVRRVEVAKVVEASRERADLEDHKALRLAKGELGLDIYNMRGRLAEKGLRYVDSIEELGG